MSNPLDTAQKFFVVGGTLGRDVASYVRRPLDEDLFQLILVGEYCNVLAARQMGKSSLMVRTAERLREQGVRVAIIDPTSIGSSVKSNEWYFGLLSRLVRELKLEMDEQSWWQSMEPKSPVQRFSDFIRDVLLEKIQDPIVIFIDEIDSTLKLDFTDDFFAAIRAAYNARSRDDVYKRLTFVLLGVARPGDLIKDRTRTPYNIGINVDVTDFQESELDSFQAVLEQNFPTLGRKVLQWVLQWTGGQPYLTQKLCSEIAGIKQKTPSEAGVASLVERLFLSDQARTETNLRSIRDRVSSSPYLLEMLEVYKRVLGGKRVMDEERSIAHNELKLTGLVKVSPGGTLQVRNRIYARIFDTVWVRNSTPQNVTNRRLVTAISTVAVFAIAAAGYFYYQQQNQAIEVQAQTYTDNFNNSTSQEVRITSLAGLFELGDEYATQAQDLFFALSDQEQLTLFELTTPDNVGNELVIVVDGVYQNIPDTETGNALLNTMSIALEQTTAAGATGLVIEITDWLAGRQALAQEQYEVAVASFTRAWERSDQRGKPNLAALYGRGLAHTSLGQFAESLTDFDSLVALDVERAGEINGIILGDENVELANYLRQHPGEFRNIENMITVPTVTPTIRPTEDIMATATSLPDEIVNQGVEMVLVPEGEFTMGDDYEPPAHTVNLDDFYIDKYEVTNSLYKVCVELGGCSLPHNAKRYDDQNYANHPVTYVDWYQAKEYCAWRDARLPTEAEWEKAARGTNGRTYPWGEASGCGYANYDAVDGTCVGNTTIVGSYERGQSPYGTYDMAGNVREWVSTLFDFPYPYNPNDGRENLLSDGVRVTRGGAWGVEEFGGGYAGIIRSSARRGIVPSDYFSNIGVRCVWDVTP